MPAMKLPTVTVGRSGGPTLTIESSAATPQKVRDTFFEAAQEQMRKAMQQVEGGVRREAPVRTGHLRRSIRYLVQVQGTSIIGTVGTDVRYGRWLDEGTGLFGPNHHRIVPVHAQALRFPQPGNKSFSLAGRRRRGKAGKDAKFVIVRSVKGVKPMRFFERGVENSRAAWTRELAATTSVAKARLGLK